MEGRKLGGIVVSLLLIGGLFYLKFQRRAETSDDVRAAMIMLVASMPEFETHGKELTQMADFAHTVAFGDAYTVGYKARRTKFEDHKYIDAFFRSMIDQARDRGRQDLIKPLSELQADTLAALEEESEEAE